MQTIKVYEAKSFDFVESFGYDLKIPNKARRLINFSNGFKEPFKQNAQFVTNDPVIQDALENDKNFNILFKLAYTDIAVPEENSVVSEPEKELESAEEPITPEEVLNDGIERVPDIATVSVAKEYLLAKFPDTVKASLLPNKAAVIEVALENKIIFTDLK